MKTRKKENYNDNIVIISHSSVIKSIICSIENISIDEILSIKLNYGYITHISYNIK